MINLVSEIRSMNRLVRAGIVVGFLTCLGFLGGAYVQWVIHQEQQAAQKRNRRQLKEQIAAATQEIGKETESARAAAENAAKRAQHAAAESIAAQIEAAEVQMRILPPRERARVAKKIEERKKTQKQLSSEL
ncbi:MAG: hypothetical protein GWN53_08730 [Gammaproteobacteria bacterium]|nr:hypothetical protein [Gammaproteobacteria bacterium]